MSVLVRPFLGFLVSTGTFTTLALLLASSV